MAEKSGDIIKHLMNMGTATINHNIDKDTAEYIVKGLPQTNIMSPQ